MWVNLTEQAIFQIGGHRTIVRVIGTNVLFMDMQSLMMSPLEGLKLSKEGIIKEHPDLKDNPDYKQIAIQRFTDKIKELPTERERMDWLILELKKMGYVPFSRQVLGHRSRKI